MQRRQLGQNKKNKPSQNNQRSRGPNPNPQNRNPGPGQQSKGPNQNPRRGHQQHRKPAAPPPPPAYFQRDILLVLDSESAKLVDEIRAKFDPLQKKVPAHLTLVLSQPASTIKDDCLSLLANLPNVGSLTFTDIVVRDDTYLWLLPDSDSAQKLTELREAIVKTLPELTEQLQSDGFEPHITLGFLPRSKSAEEIVAMAKQTISLPQTIKFEKILLEEFNENQLSIPVKSMPV